MAEWFDVEDEKYDPEQREREEAERLARLEAERLEREEAERERRENERLLREEERLKKERELLERQRENDRLRKAVARSELWDKVKRIALIALAVIVAGAILFGIVYGIIAAIRGIAGAVSRNRERREYERYSIDNIVIEEAEKEGSSARIDYTIKNNSTLDIEYISGDMKIYNIYGDVVASVDNLYYDGTISSGGIKETYFTFSDGSYKNNFYDYPISELTVEYDIEKIEYENGEAREYDNAVKYVHRVNLAEGDAPEYSLDNIIYTISSKNEYSNRIEQDIKNNGPYDMTFLTLEMKVYDLAGNEIERISIFYSGTVKAHGENKAIGLNVSDYSDEFYYSSLDNIKVEIAIKSVTYSNGITKTYPENYVEIYAPAGNGWENVA